jgi:very-short-patch-repair endonuclease
MEKNSEYKVRTFVCAACGQSVTGRARPAQRYCSHACYTASPKPARRTGHDANCEQCGKAIYVKKRQSEKHRAFFCGIDCSNMWQGRNKDTFTCKVCGKTFRWSASRRRGYKVTYCSIPCRDADPDRKAMLVAMTAAQAKMKPNKLERAGYAMLDALNIEYEQQHPIGGKFCVDAFVPSVGLVIQFDGDYWHGNPDVFPEPDARQRHRMKLDISQDAYMAACGYRVLRLWETHIRKSPEQVEDLVRAALAVEPALAEVEI